MAQILINVLFFSTIVEEDEDVQSDIVMQLPIKDIEVSVPPLILSSPEPISSPVLPTTPFTDTPLIMPTAMSVKQEATHFNVQVAESEYYNNRYVV